MKVRECFEKSLLVKTRVSRETVKSTIGLAEHLIGRAEGNFDMEYFDVAFTLAYQAMLHTARALLFMDGIKERSHVYVVAYLKEKYGKDPRLSKHINLLDSYRIGRHEIMYRGGEVSKDEASISLQDAKDFLRIARGILSSSGFKA